MDDSGSGRVSRFESADHRRHAEVELTIHDLKHDMASTTFDVEPRPERRLADPQGHPSRGQDTTSFIEIVRLAHSRNSRAKCVPALLADRLVERGCPRTGQLSSDLQ